MEDDDHDGRDEEIRGAEALEREEEVKARRDIARSDT